MTALYFLISCLVHYPREMLMVMELHAMISSLRIIQVDERSFRRLLPSYLVAR